MNGLDPEHRRVLIIDEEGKFTRALGRYLSDLGLRVSTASRWTAALESIGHESFQAILINPHLSSVNGETILRFLRDEGNPIPVVVVADQLEPDRIQNLRQLGANEFVQKTDAFYHIAQALSRVLPGWSAEAAPVLTEEEFEQIMIQRLNEVADEAEPGPSPVAKVAEPSTSPTAAPKPQPLRPASSTDSTEPAIRAAESPEPEPSRDRRRPVSLPPPPPLTAESGQRPEKRVRRRRVGKKNSAGRIFTVIFLVCLVTGVLYLGLTKGLSDFVKGPIKPPAEQPR